MSTTTEAPTAICPGLFPVVEPKQPDQGWLGGMFRGGSRAAISRNDFRIERLWRTLGAILHRINRYFDRVDNKKRVFEGRAIIGGPYIDDSRVLIEKRSRSGTRRPNLTLVLSIIDRPASP